MDIVKVLSANYQVSSGIRWSQVVCLIYQMHKSSLIEEKFMLRSWIRSLKRESLAKGKLIFLKIQIHNIYRTLFLQRIFSRESD
jgi:hypothetical protein